jgi:predicted Zn-dependent peptidase
MNHYLGDPGKLGEYMSRIASVTNDDVKRVVAEQLPTKARAIVVTVPKAEKGGAE